jgi:hypothetical protein
MIPVHDRRRAQSHRLAYEYVIRRRGSEYLTVKKWADGQEDILNICGARAEVEAGWHKCLASWYGPPRYEQNPQLDLGL